MGRTAVMIRSETGAVNSQLSPVAVPGECLHSSWDRPILIDEGEADDFLQRELQPERFVVTPA